MYFRPCLARFSVTYTSNVTHPPIRTHLPTQVSRVIQLAYDDVRRLDDSSANLRRGDSVLAVSVLCVEIRCIFLLLFVCKMFCCDMMAWMVFAKLAFLSPSITIFYYSPPCLYLRPSTTAQVFPETTSFYRAVVVKTPKMPGNVSSGNWEVRFFI